MIDIKQWRVPTVLAASLLFLAACDSPAPTGKDSATQTTVAPIATMPTAAVTMGKTKATEQFMTGQWRVVSMNGRDIDGDLMLDLREFGAGKGEFYDGCERILVDLNTHDVSNEKLAVDKSVRHHSACDSELIENIMWLLSDIYAFERENEDLLIIATQDTIRLTPIK